VVKHRHAFYSYSNCKLAPAPNSWEANDLLVINKMFRNCETWLFFTDFIWTCNICLCSESGESNPHFNVLFI